MPKCDGCTLCCYLFSIPEIKKPGNTECTHMCKEGCDIYDSRPDCCRGFNCAYLQQKNPDIRLRPDKCGVVFEIPKLNGDEEANEGLVDTDTGAVKTIAADDQQGYSVVIRLKGKRFFFLTTGNTMQAAILALNKFLRVKYGLPKLYN